MLSNCSKLAANTGAALTLALTLSGCQVASVMIPGLTPKQEKKMEESQVAFTRATIYGDALDALGESINKKVNYTTIVQSKNIENTAGGAELPIDVTNMVTSSVNRMAGRRLVFVPYDPNYYQQEAATDGLKGRRVLPDVVIAGSITEFDKDVETKGGGFNLDVIFGGASGQTDVGGELMNSENFTRVTIDLHLIDYKTQAYIPGVQATNTIYVYEVTKSNQLGFMVYGSGVGGNGRLKTSQGLHQAVRNLIELSVLEVMGKYYDLPYWQGFGSERADSKVMKTLKKSFSRKSKPAKIFEVQKLLVDYKIGPVHVNGKTYDTIKPDGVMGTVTRAFITSFLYAHKLQHVNPDDLVTVYFELLSNRPLG